MTDQSVTLSSVEWDAICNQLAIRITQIAVASRNTKLRVSERAMTLAMSDELGATLAKIEAQISEPIASRKA